MKYNPMYYVTKVFNNKKFLMAFSFVCAVIFWLVIDISENPTREVTVSGISVTITDQTDDNGGVLMVIGDYQDEVSVSVSGPGYIVSNVDKGDISVSVVSYADVNSPGTYVLNLTATVDVSGCTVTKISPSYIKVDYDYDTTADVPVEVDVTELRQFMTSELEIYKSTLKSNTDGSDITALNVTGPSEVIGSISKVVAKPVLPSEVKPETQNFSEISLEFYDVVGNVIDKSELVYNTDLYVRAVVYKVADVSLKPSFVNLPKCYAESDSGLPAYKLYPISENARTVEELTVVKVRGPIETMNELIVTGITLNPIDFMYVEPNTTSFDVSFILPDDVEVVDGTKEVTVKLSLGKLKSIDIEIEADDINFIGLPEGLSAKSAITGKIIKIKVCYDSDKIKGGTSTVRKAITSSLVLNVDLTGITNASSVTKPITVSTKDKTVYAWAISINPDETMVEIK